jgi:hypothetical protein
MRFFRGMYSPQMNEGALFKVIYESCQIILTHEGRGQYLARLEGGKSDVIVRARAW